jgi:hypothetical protein
VFLLPNGDLVCARLRNHIFSCFSTIFKKHQSRTAGCVAEGSRAGLLDVLDEMDISSSEEDDDDERFLDKVRICVVGTNISMYTVCVCVA